MDFADQDAQRQNKRGPRYSVSKLLALSREFPASFDLSKFSYNAVRAGVVPALRSCAMPIRDVSTNHPRVWSTETDGAMEDCVVYQGNSAQHPRRQPHHAPIEPLAQTSEGFARFLRKHTSPTHQRVTAGGRIVPMEKRPPPKFPLSKDPAMVIGSPSRNDDCGTIEDTRTKRQVTSNRDISQLDNIRTANNSTSVGNSTIPLSSANDTHLTANVIPALGSGGVGPIGSPDAVSHGVGHPLFPAVLLPSNVNANGTLDQVLTHPMALFNHTLLPFAATVPSYPVPYPMMSIPNALWQYPEQYGIPNPQNPAFPGVETQNPMALHSSLLNATAVFEELDRQLKDIDRHRAMHSLDPALASQRLTIMEHRATAKETIRRLHHALNMEPISKGSNQDVCNHHHGLNVQAESYIPKSSPKKSQESSGTSRAYSEPKTQTPGHLIVSPTNNLSPNQDDPFVTPEHALADFPSSPEAESVDKWGARLGRPPPEVERHQTALAAAIKREMNTSHSDEEGDSLSEDLLRAVQLLECDNEGKEEIDRDQPSIEDGMAQTVWDLTSSGPDSLQAEHDSVLQLAAMRKPKGITTRVQLIDGDVIAVEGKDLRRPPSVDMNSVERAYWSRIAKEDEDNTNQADQQGQGGPLTDAGSMACNGTVVEHEHTGGLVIPKKDHKKVLADFLRINTARSARNPPSPRARTSAVENLSFLSPSSGGVKIEPEARRQNYSTFDEGDVNMKSYMSNKGYSSVAVQNVHAVSRLPQGLDGSLDAAQRKNRKESSASQSQVKSPRVVHRTTATGEVWYGPFRRNEFEQSDHERRREGIPHVPGLKRTF